MGLNPLVTIDFYKADHRRQYPKGTTEIYSNLTARFVKESHSLLCDFDNKIVVFGIQLLLQDYFLYHWQEGFFNQPKKRIIEEYKDLIETALGIEDFDCSHIEALHDLGYLPIRIKAIPEGMRVPIGVPILTIVNTHPDFFWLTNYLETIISATLWKPITAATIAFEFRRCLTVYAFKTCDDIKHVAFQAHDFSFRGMSGLEDAANCGAAHLTSFQGTDCLPAIVVMKNVYDADEHVSFIGGSVPASEHSVMTCLGESAELQTIRRLITEIYPTGIVSIVADSYDFWRTMTQYLPLLKVCIMAREGKLVIRPDSGNPVDIICGDATASEGSPERRGALEILWDTFGGVVNSKGYKELDSHVGLIYGDAITVERANMILGLMELAGFASNNIVFGVGSYSYQYVTRDTFGFAMKATSCVIDGVRHAIFKNPKTGETKKSAKGLLQVLFDNEIGSFILCEDVNECDEVLSCLETVFADGDLLDRTNLFEIRSNLDMELNALLD